MVMPPTSTFAMTFGAELIPNGGVRFRLYAPSATSVELALDGAAPEPLHRDDDGFFLRVDSRARAGSRYAFVVDGLRVPDPASRFNPEGPHGPSVVIDPGAFLWPQDDWRGRPWHEHVFYEIHVGTFTPEGTYAAAAAKLPLLVELGITAIELMPLAQAPGERNWGYDGVLLYAPAHTYGTPDDLKALVARAHALGIALYLDVVYNHFGPEGNYLHAYAREFYSDRHDTPWGAAIDVLGNAHVRLFFIQNALYWLEEFRFDGLRIATRSPRSRKRRQRKRAPGSGVPRAVERRRASRGTRCGHGGTRRLLRRLCRSDDRPPGTYAHQRLRLSGRALGHARR